MATGGVAGGKARELNGNHRVAVHGEQPANRAAEVLVARTPALRTRPVDGGDEVLQNIRQKRDRLHRRGRFHGVHILDAVLVAALKSACVNALAASEAQGSLRGVAVGVKRDFRSRAAEGFGQSLGGLGHGERAHDKAARRGVPKSRHGECPRHRARRRPCRRAFRLRHAERKQAALRCRFQTLASDSP